MHCAWTRKIRAWGYDVIRGIDEDDPLRVIRAFKHPIELMAVDLNTKVEVDYGGYAWTEWMHAYFGDTALHIALKWKRHRAVKALLSMRSDWKIPNDKGITAEQLVLRLYGKDMQTFKDEQEREYESGSMRTEEEAMRRLLAAEQDARERAHLNRLHKLHAARTIGIESEAAILFKCGRILAKEAVEHDTRVALPRGAVARRWASRVCREVRHNRFAAQRGAMRRNVLPTQAMSLSPGSTAIGASSTASQPTSEGTARSRIARSRVSGRLPTSPGSRQRHTKAHAGASNTGGGGSRLEARSIFDNELASERKSHAGRRSPPSAGQKRSRSPRMAEKKAGKWDGSGSRPLSPAGLSRLSAAGALSRPCSPNRLSRLSSPGGTSLASGSQWSRKTNGRRSQSPTSFERSSRMAIARTTHILAAGTSVQRLTPVGRLQRKMAIKHRAAVAAAAAVNHRISAAQMTQRPCTVPGAHPPRLTDIFGSSSAATRGANGLVNLTRSRGGRQRGFHDTRSATSCTNTSEFAVGASTPSHAVAPVTAKKSRDDAVEKVPYSGGDSGGAGMDDAKAPASPPPSVEGELSIRDPTDLLRDRIKNSCEDCGREDGREDRVDSRVIDDSADEVTPATLKASPRMGTTLKVDGMTATPGEDGNVNSNRDRGTTVPSDNMDLAHSQSPKRPASPSLESPTPSVIVLEQRIEAECTQDQPMKNALAALMISAVIHESGEGIVAPNFPRISAQYELKYGGPIASLQAAVMASVISVRPGVLTHLALPGKRLGDEGAIALASTLMTIRSVDLRQNNIGDSGGRAIASALMPHDVTTEVSLMSCPQPQRLERHQPEHQRQQHERASPDADRIGGDRNTALRQCPKNRLHALQTLSLAGNRIGDAGANALSEMLEFRKRRSNVDHEALLGHVKPNTRESCEFRWLSVAENPRISECGQKRLIGAATRCFLPHGSDKNRGVDRLDCNFVVIV